MRRLILASGSPRRRMLLEQAGLSFEIMVSEADESIEGKGPEETVQELSMRKAVSIEAQTAGDRVILAADTVVSYEDRILGKPENEREAASMLQMLQGQTHQVYTGVTILHLNGEKRDAECFSICTQVTMYPAADREILRYIRTGEPADKAGAYAIQGKGFYFVKEIQGDYNNVVGLPTQAIRRVLELVRPFED